MLAYPSLLVPAAQQAKMSVPEDPDDFDPEAFPHFQVFCILQLARPMNPGDHWHNAETLVKLSETECKTFTQEAFEKAGFIFKS